MKLAKLIRSARGRIAPYIVRTPLVTSGNAHFKCENLQYTGSFKLRGALNKILALPLDVVERGVVAASTGNHGRAVAHALQVVGARGTIWIPTTVPQSKVDALRASSNIELKFHGTDSAQTEIHARAIASETGRAFVSPYNDIDVIAGQGTIALELLEQCPGVDVVFVAVGGGGLITGTAAALKAHRPNIRVVGCWPENSPALYAAILAGRIVDVPELPTLSDGTAGGIEPGAITFDLARELIDGTVLVTESEIAAAIRFVHAQHDMVIEGAAGVAVAAYQKTSEAYAGKTVAIILCGGNIDPAKHEAILDG